MNNDIELKPCPFCGQNPEILGDGTHDVFGIHCLHCDYELGYFDTKEEAADAWNTRSQADAPEHAPKTTLKQAVCSIIEILEQMKKQISDDGKGYLALSIRSFSNCSIAFSVYSERADEIWSLPNYAENLEDFRSFEISEEKIASFLKAKIKTPEQILKAAIEEKGTELAELKAKLARLEKKGIEWKK